MGRDDNCQSVGIFKHRLKKTPPRPRFAGIPRGAMMDKATDAYPLLVPTPRAHEDNSETKTRRQHTSNVKNQAQLIPPPDFASPTVAAESTSFDISVDKRERRFQRRAAWKEQLLEDDLPGSSRKIPPSSASYDQNVLENGLGAGPQNPDQANSPRLDGFRPLRFWGDPAKTLEESYWKRSPPRLSSVGPDPQLQYVLPKFQRVKAVSPQHGARSPYVPGLQHAPEIQPTTSGYPAQTNVPSNFQHYIPGETYEDYAERFNRRYGDILDLENRSQGRKRPLHEMNRAGEEAEPGSRTPSNTPPESVKKPDLKGSRKLYQACAPSVFSMDSTAETNFMEDKGEPQDDIEKDLAARVRGVCLDGYLHRKTPSDLPHGSHAGAAKDQFSSAIPSVLRNISSKRLSKVKGEHQHHSNPQKSPEASSIIKNSKTNLSGRSADVNTPKNPKRKARTFKETTLDDLGHLNNTDKREINAKDLERMFPQPSASSRANFERLISQKQLGVQLPSPNAPFPSFRDPKPCLFLDILPPEIRRLIYRNLLCTPKIIPGGELVEDKRTAIIIPDAVPPTMNLSIDATFLRACRAIYSEALPILYQDNWFGFSKVSMLRVFRTKGLPITQTPSDSPYKNKSVLRYLDSISAHDFAFNPEPQGRLCLLRNLHLKLSHSGRSASLRGMRSPSWDDTEWHPAYHDHWSAFLNEERYTDVVGYVTFPALKHLVLDFSDWELQPDEGLRVRAFKTRFRGEEGLRILTSVGLSHGATIRAFGEKLLGKEGKMRVLERGASVGVV